MRLLKLPDYIRAYRAKRRDPDWRDVLELFQFHGDGVAAIPRLSRVWVHNHGLQAVNIFSGEIIKESWTAERIGRLVDEMAGIPHKSGLRNSMRTSEPPRFKEFPLIVVRTQGKEFFIDGRRRANQWRHEDSEFAVWIIQVVPRGEKLAGVR